MKLAALLAALTLALPAYARISPPEMRSYECRHKAEVKGVEGVKDLGSNEFVVSDEVFDSCVDIFKRLHPEQMRGFVRIAGFYNYVTDAESRPVVFSELRGLGYNKDEASCITWILTEDGNIVISESGYNERNVMHERMHRNVDSISPEEWLTLYKKWLEARDNGGILTYKGAAARLFAENGEFCDGYCEKARERADHFYIYLCEGRLPASERAVEDIRELAGKICER